MDGWNSAAITDVVEDWAERPEKNIELALAPSRTNETNGHFDSSEGPQRTAPRVVVVFE